MSSSPEAEPTPQFGRGEEPERTERRRLRLPELNLPGTADAEGWRRLHALSPFLRGGITFLVILGVIIAGMRDILIRFVVDGPDVDMDWSDVNIGVVQLFTDRQTSLGAIIGVVVLIALIVLGSWLGWLFRSYRITSEAVEARSGIIFKQHRRAPLDRVQSVNLQRSLLARIVGLTKIEILTGGQGGKVELSYLGHKDAKSVREQILQLAAAKREGRSIEAAVDTIVGAAPVSYDGSAYAPAADRLTERAQDFVDFDVEPEAAPSLVRVPLGRLIGSTLLGWEAVVTVLLIIAVLGWGFVSTAIGALTGRPNLLAAGGISLITLIPLILVMLGVMFSQINKGFNFTLSRGRDSVRVGSGLTSTVTDSIPFGRIHAVDVRQPLFWRPFGWWRVRVTLAGHSVAEAGQSVTQNVMLPVGPENDVLRVIEALMPGACDELSEDLHGSGTGYTGAGPRAGWLLWFAKKRTGAKLLVPADLGDVSPDRVTLRLRKGFMTRSLSIVPVVRAQSVELQRPMCHYFLGLAAVQVHTVLGPVSTRIRGLALSDALALFESVRDSMLEVQAADKPGQQQVTPREGDEQ